MVWDGKQLKYGPINPVNIAGTIKVAMGASEVIKAASGRFVKLDASGYAEMAVDGTTEIYAWVEGPEETTSATEGGTIYNGIVDPAQLFKLPINSGTYVISMRGKTCDISVSTNIQGVQLDASAEDTLIIHEGDLVNNAWVIVQVNPNKRGATSVV